MRMSNKLKRTLNLCEICIVASNFYCAQILRLFHSDEILFSSSRAILPRFFFMPVLLFITCCNIFFCFAILKISHRECMEEILTT